MSDNPYWMSYHRQVINEMNDRIDACNSAVVDALNAGHKQNCKWVEVLGRQPAAHWTWCDCGKITEADKQKRRNS